MTVVPLISFWLFLDWSKHTHQERATVRCRLVWCRVTWCLATVWPRALKALVWFWLIDETLSANLVYQSVHEIGRTFQVTKQMMIIT